MLDDLNAKYDAIMPDTEDTDGRLDAAAAYWRTLRTHDGATAAGAWVYTRLRMVDEEVGNEAEITIEDVDTIGRHLFEATDQHADMAEVIASVESARYRAALRVLADEYPAIVMYGSLAHRQEQQEEEG